MLAPQILNFSNGEFVATDQWFDKRSPVSSAVIGQVAKPARRRWMPPWRFFKVKTGDSAYPISAISYKINSNHERRTDPVTWVMSSTRRCKCVAPWRHSPLATPTSPSAAGDSLRVTMAGIGGCSVRFV